jgi:voltage-gated potassium channel
MSTSPLPQTQSSAREALDEQRHELLQRLEDGLETPMLVLAFVWLALLMIDLIQGSNALFETLGTVIWIVLILDFALELTLTPRKLTYLKRNGLTALSLLVPALRILRLFRLWRVLRMARAARGMWLLRVLSSLNRGMRALGATLSRRGFGYVPVMTPLVTCAGAAGPELKDEIAALRRELRASDNPL